MSRSKGRGTLRNTYGLRATDTGMPVSSEPKGFGEPTSITATTPTDEQKAENKAGGKAGRRPRETWIQRALREEQERRERSGNPEGQ